MNDSIVYNIPVTWLEAYRARNLVLRSRRPEELIQDFGTDGLEKIAYVQIIGTSGSIDDLLRWKQPVPVDLVVEDPQIELPLLYRYSPLLGITSVRVSVPVVQGFSRLVKLALALDFAVKLEPSQPEPERVEELHRVAELYLHGSTVSQPVEYIHSLFMAFLHGSPLSLWNVQEEDPNRDRFVTDDGVEILSKRFAAGDMKHGADVSIDKFTEGLIAKKGECRQCRFFEVCLGYFKWPRKDYRCDGVKTLFEMLTKAAEELKADLSSHPSSQ